jgi:ankyrin repeat protein
VQRPAAHPDAFHALAAAVQANDASAASRVLAEHVELAPRLNDPMPGESFGATPLLGAVHRSNREMIDVLLRAGADINARSHWWAGSFGVLDHDGDLAEVLIARGAAVDAHAAARLGMVDRLTELIAASPGIVHARGGDGQTPLHFASTLAIARVLLDHGADVDARDVDHESTPAQYMIRDRQDVARFLVERGCRTDLLMVSALGDLDRVRAHVERDPASVFTTVSERYFPKDDDRSGGSIYIWTLGANKTAHIVAREFGHERVFQWLMERSPDTMKLAIACELSDAAVVDALIEARPDLARSLSDDERRRLNAAAQDNNTEAVRLMLRAGWPTDVRDQMGATPLHWAAWHGNAVMVRDLARKGAPLEAPDTSHGGTPLGWAVHGSTNGRHCKTGDYGGAVDALLSAGAQRPASTAAMHASEAVKAALGLTSR